ncbi:NUDIX domain-containing protein [Spirosoma aureum]|uniref:NUDIX domain-containing protein n=1 Tax=Spirosoma aureum TaxID=2692134 RepID=A0A6G9AG10_9BACT|nr:NUDIX domain-containing protein [Spirosoma aureum]QIP11390.1 NUDIX domain-containing protein [Spirosoma aureum]
MTYSEQLNAFYKMVSDECVQGVSLDCVIFGFHDTRLKVLLLRWKNTQEWCLPGGFIYKTESVDVAAERVLRERTGLDQLFLQQFHLFGDAVRYNREDTWQRQKMPMPFESGGWPERTLSIGYYAVVDQTKVMPTADFMTDECRWWEVSDLPSLLYDHQHIVEVALQTLRLQLSWQPIGLNLMPEKFTIPELQRLYEAVLGRLLDARNFHKKIMGLHILTRLDERRTGKAHKSPYLYQFDRENYQKALISGNLSFV